MKKGAIFTQQHKKKLSLARLGKSPWNKGQKLSIEYRKKLSKAHLGIKMPVRSIEHRQKLSETQKGIKSHFWKGGVSIENKKIRASIEFRLWREAVFARDNWTCQECKVRGGKLHPHHLKSFALFPELRFAIDNGQTLCEKCHHKTDTWGVVIKSTEKTR